MIKYYFVLRKSLPLALLFLVQNLSALDLQNIEITKKEAGFDFRGEYNKTLNHSIDFSALGSIELNEQFKFKSGLALGNTGGGFDIKTFIQSGIGPLFNRPLYASLSYVYNGLPDYESHAHIILPFVSYNGQRAGISIGPNFRFNRYFGELSVFESTLSFLIYVYLINYDKLRIGMNVANFNDFYVGLFGSYFLNLNSLIRINNQWSIVNDIELLQSGGTALTTNFYGIVYRGGVRFSW